MKILVRASTAGSNIQFPNWVLSNMQNYYNWDFYGGGFNRRPNGFNGSHYMDGRMSPYIPKFIECELDDIIHMGISNYESLNTGVLLAKAKGEIVLIAFPVNKAKYAESAICEGLQCKMREIDIVNCGYIDRDSILKYKAMDDINNTVFEFINKGNYWFCALVRHSYIAYYEDRVQVTLGSYDFICYCDNPEEVANEVLHHMVNSLKSNPHYVSYPYYKSGVLKYLQNKGFSKG